MHTYPAHFAQSIWMPFSSGPFREFIDDTAKTKADWMSDPRTAQSETGHTYTSEHRAILWNTITAQRNRVQTIFTRQTQN